MGPGEPLNVTASVSCSADIWALPIAHGPKSWLVAHLREKPLTSRAGGTRGRRTKRRIPRTSGPARLRQYLKQNGVERFIGKSGKRTWHFPLRTFGLLVVKSPRSWNLFQSGDSCFKIGQMGTHSPYRKTYGRCLSWKIQPVLIVKEVTFAGFVPQDLVSQSILSKESAIAWKALSEKWCFKQQLQQLQPLLDVFELILHPKFSIFTSSIAVTTFFCMKKTSLLSSRCFVSPWKWRRSKCIRI